jgi:hypothetical protein
MAYMSQENKKKITAELKKVIPTSWKWSLAVLHHSTLRLTIASAPVDLLKMNTGANNTGVGYTSPNEYYLEREFSGELLCTFQDIRNAMNTGNHDRSDSQSDYFDVGWYIDIRIGSWEKPFKCTGSDRDTEIALLKQQIAAKEAEMAAQKEYDAYWAGSISGQLAHKEVRRLNLHDSFPQPSGNIPQPNTEPIKRSVPEYDETTASSLAFELETRPGNA